MLRTQSITQEQYDLGNAKAKELIEQKGVVEYQPDLHQEAANDSKDTLTQDL
ncbi:MAG: hypothetical protein IJ295_03285 [Clostridia bacterium]|nr:hypothetical protein [Clostridia bacterium]